MNHDHLIILYVHQEEIINIDVCKIANYFIAEKESRKERFSISHKFLNIRINTVFDSG